MTSRLIVSLLCISVISATATAEPPVRPNGLMRIPGELIAKKKQHIKEIDRDFMIMETQVDEARRAEDDYVVSKKPELVRRKEDGVNKNRFPSELGLVRAQLEAAGDRILATLIAETNCRQAPLEAHFPEAFPSMEAAVETRNANH